MEQPEKLSVFTMVRHGSSQQELETLMSTEGDWKTKDKHGLSILHVATAVGNVNAARYFISLGADVNDKAADKTTPIHHLARFTPDNFYSEMLGLLVEAGVDINAVDESGYNALFKAVIAKRSQMQLEQLINVGCSMKTENKYGYSILHMTASQGNLEAMKFFISNGENVNAKNKFEATPLILTAFARQNIPEMVKLLVENGADLNVVDKDGNTVLIFAVQSSTGPTKADVELLVQLGCDWNIANKVGNTVMHVAAGDGNVDVLSYLINLKIPVDARNTAGETPFHGAVVAKRNHLETVNMLLEAGADINAVEKNGITPLFLAIWREKTNEELNHLVSCGADWKKTIYDGQTVLHLAVFIGTPDALSYFIDKGADVNAVDERKRKPIHLCAFTGKCFEEKVDLLLEKGADINELDNEGNNLLFLGTFHGRSKKELEHVVNHGGIWNLRNQLYNSTILHMAVEGDNLEALKLFISLGADVNALDSLQTSPLSRAAASNQPNSKEIMKVLLGNGAVMRNLDVISALIYQNMQPGYLGN